MVFNYYKYTTFFSFKRFRVKKKQKNYIITTSNPKLYKLYAIFIHK